MPSAQFLCHTHDVKPGEMRRIKLGTHAILLANVEGSFYAVDDLCTHEDAILSNGALKGRCVECPLHGSRFDLSNGLPLEEPATLALRTHTLVIDGNKIFVELAD